VHIATLGTAMAVLLALPVAFLAALNTTFNRGTYLLARLLIVGSRSVDSLIWALIFIIIVGAGGIGFVLNEAILGLEWARVSLILLVILGVVALSEVASAWIRRRLA